MSCKVSYLDQYKRRVLSGKKDIKDLETWRKQQSFDQYLKNSPTSGYYQATKPNEPNIHPNTRKILMAITDVANNDKTSYDEKNIVVRYDCDLDVGCYVRFDDEDWLIVYKEHQSINVKKHFIMRKCNNYISIKLKGKIYKIPILVENLTMYSDGIADNIYLSFMDSKKQIWYGNNFVTRTIYENYRILLTHRTAFRITHINDFEYNGLIKSLVLQTAVLKGDDFTNLLADNDARYSSTNHDEIEDNPKKPQLKIIGDNKIIIGEEKEYYILSGKNGVRWELSDEKIFTIVSQTNENIVIRGSFNFKDIGKKAILKAIDIDKQEVCDTIEITLRR